MHLSSLLPLLVLATDAVARSWHPEKSEYGRLPTLREQEAIELKWIEKRFALIPKVLGKYGFDAYIVTQREYAEDTIFRSLVPYVSTFSARRRTLYLFHTSPLAPSPLHLIDNTPALFETLNATLAIINPKKIAINVDRGIAFSDGLHSGEGEVLKQMLGPTWVSKLDSETMIGVEVVATRVGGDEQLGIYKQMQENVWAMIEEGFSNKIITPNVTSTQDLQWWFRERMETMNATTWFHPSVSLFRPSFQTNPGQPFPSPDDGAVNVIQEGDMLHVDIGVFQMGMATDTQHLAYVLKANETSPPAGLQLGLVKSNRLQDIVRSTMKPGKTGDEILAECRATMAKEGLKGLIYSHPIGDYGHSAGTPIGMTNLQKSVPVSGQLPMLPHTWYSIELSAESFVPEWNLTQNFFQEEDVYWSEETQGWEWVWGRQEKFHLVKPRPAQGSTGAESHATDPTVSPVSPFQLLLQGMGWRVGRWW